MKMESTLGNSVCIGNLVRMLDSVLCFMIIYPEISPPSLVQTTLFLTTHRVTENHSGEHTNLSYCTVTFQKAKSNILVILASYM